MLSLGAVLSVTAARAEVLTLQNGDRITGTYLEGDGAFVMFKPAYGPAMRIPRAEIARLSDGVPAAAVTVTEMRADGATAQSVAPALASAPVAPPEVAEPPAKKEKNILSGNIKGGLTATDGNERTQDYYASLDMKAEKGKNRGTLKSDYFYATDSDGGNSRDEGSLRLKYDRFLTERFYVFTNASFRKDAITGLNLRSATGAGPGYRFGDGENLIFEAEAGPNYVIEDYENADDNEYIAARWEADYMQKFDKFKLFHNQEGTFSLENAEDLAVQSETGVSVPVYKGAEVAAELHADYENNPPPGKRNTDLTYIATLGYSW